MLAAEGKCRRQQLAVLRIDRSLAITLLSHKDSHAQKNHHVDSIPQRGKRATTRTWSLHERKHPLWEIVGKLLHVVKEVVAARRLQLLLKSVKIAVDQRGRLVVRHVLLSLNRFV